MVERKTLTAADVISQAQAAAKEGPVITKDFIRVSKEEARQVVEERQRRGRITLTKKTPEEVIREAEAILTEKRLPEIVTKIEPERKAIGTSLETLDLGPITQKSILRQLQGGILFVREKIGDVASLVVSPLIGKERSRAFVKFATFGFLSPSAPPTTIFDLRRKTKTIPGQIVKTGEEIPGGTLVGFKTPDIKESFTVGGLELQLAALPIRAAITSAIVKGVSETVINPLLTKLRRQTFVSTEPTVTFQQVDVGDDVLTFKTTGEARGFTVSELPGGFRKRIIPTDVSFTFRGVGEKTTIIDLADDIFNKQLIDDVLAIAPDEIVAFSPPEIKIGKDIVGTGRLTSITKIPSEKGIKVIFKGSEVKFEVRPLKEFGIIPFEGAPELTRDVFEIVIRDIDDIDTVSRVLSQRFVFDLDEGKKVFLGREAVIGTSGKDVIVTTGRAFGLTQPEITPFGGVFEGGTILKQKIDTALQAISSVATQQAVAGAAASVGQIATAADIEVVSAAASALITGAAVFQAGKLKQQIDIVPSKIVFPTIEGPKDITIQEIARTAFPTTSGFGKLVKDEFPNLFKTGEGPVVTFDVTQEEILIPTQAQEQLGGVRQTSKQAQVALIGVGQISGQLPTVSQAFAQLPLQKQQQIQLPLTSQLTRALQSTFQAQPRAPLIPSLPPIFESLKKVGKRVRKKRRVARVGIRRKIKISPFAVPSFSVQFRRGLRGKKPLGIPVQTPATLKRFARAGLSGPRSLFTGITSKKPRIKFKKKPVQRRKKRRRR